ncbi:MAG: hypothetical protein H6727_16750 [Myxococcales bacterium]|nr:hypothetical protein [Myxococcales bacterium]
MESHFRPKDGSPAASGAFQLQGNAFFDKVGFIGGVDPKADWTTGWTNYDPN